jgi:hypothetical protein
MLTKNEFFLSAHQRQARLVDEMAVALLDAGAFAIDDATCWQILRLAGFSNTAIAEHLYAARDLARAAVAVS